MDVSQLEIIAPLVFVTLLTVTVGVVVLLRPITKHLGNLLEAMAQAKRQPQVGDQIQRTNDVLDTISARLALLEERQDFTDALLHDPERRKLLSGREARGIERGSASDGDPSGAE